jgi:predicted ATPase/DNA-binding SARP family transcriptional activator
MKPQFELTLLGSFQLTIDGEPVSTLTSEKIQALLAYLAVEQTQSHSREALAELLWPDRPAGGARQNLRQALSRLQRALPATAEPLLQLSRQTVRFHRASHAFVDVAALTERLAQVQQHAHETVVSCQVCCERLTTAVTYYHGDFLDGLFCDSPAFDEWALLKREWLRREVLRALDLLVQHHEAAQEWQAAYRFAWRRVEIDPLVEEAHQQVMRALAHSGRRTAALAQYATLTQLLREELAVAPAAATTALYDAIRTDQLAPLSPRRTPTVTEPPPLRAIPHNLPPQQTPFVGRRHELQQIADRLAQPECHLLTLVGPGGAGKTRLALEVADHQRTHAAQRYADGIYFVPLATATDDDQLLTALAAALDYHFPDTAQGRAARLTALCRKLQDKACLLVLDNLEQIAESTGIPSAILEAAPAVQLLVTSRVPLHLRAEWLFDIVGLDYPGAEPDDAAPRSLATYEAVQFFTTASQRVLADFTLSDSTLSLVGDLCMLTQGMPLALELAAAQVRTEPLPVLLAAVRENLDTLATTMRDVPARHRSLRAVFNHSWQLLPPPLQQLFCRLAVFHGAFDATAATTVTGCTAGELAALCRYSLLYQTATAPTPRYALHEVLRQYAAEQLVCDPAVDAATHRQHCDYYLTLIAEAEAELNSSRAAQSVAKVRLAFENIRGAWQWAVVNGRLQPLAQSIHGLLRYFILTSQAEEGGQLFDGALHAVTAHTLHADSDPAAQALLADLHALRARLFFKQARYPEGEDHAQQALALAEAVGAPRPATLANLYWGICLLSQGEYGAAEEKLQRTLTLARQHPWPKVEGDALRALGMLAEGRRDLAKARHFYEAALAVSQDLDDPRGTSATIGNLGSICRQQGDFVAARTFLEQSLAIHRTIGDRSSEGRTLTHLGELALDLEEYGTAEQLVGEAIQLLRDLREEHYAADALVVLGQIYRRQGRVDLAVASWQAALPIYEAAHEAPAVAEVQSYLQAAAVK